MTDDPAVVAPPVPARLLNRPTTPGGRVIPWVNVRLADGGVDFRATHRAKVERAWRGRLCQVDGQPLGGGRMVLLGGPNQLADLVFDEPPLHPECARYTALACEMVAGRLSRYASGPSVSETHRGASCVDEGCECAGWVPDGGARPAGEPAHVWYLVWAVGYHVAYSPGGGLHGGALGRADVRAVDVVTPGVWPPWRRLSAGEVGGLVGESAVDARLGGKGRL